MEGLVQQETCNPVPLRLADMSQESMTRKMERLLRLLHEGKKGYESNHFKSFFQC